MMQSTIMRFKEDEILLQQGEIDKKMYKILAGKAAVYINYGQSDECLLRILSEQSCFGEITLLCGKPSIYTVVALEETLALCVNEENFEQFIKNNSRNAIDIMRSLAHTSVNLSFNLEQLSTELNELVAELHQNGQVNSDMVASISKRIGSLAAGDAATASIITQKP